MTKILLLAVALILATPAHAQRIGGRDADVTRWQYCVKVAKVTQQPCIQALQNLRAFMNAQSVVDISTPITLIDADLQPLPTALPRERHFHRRRHR